MSKVKTACVTGANRGIGYEFAKQLSDQGWRVVAGYREPSRSESLLKNATKNSSLLPFQVDSTNEKGLRQLHDFIAEHTGSLDLLINNAGVLIAGDATLDNLSVDNLVENFRVNVAGVLVTTRQLLPLLRRGSQPKIINIGSRTGSISLATPDYLAYRISKAALNMLTKMQAHLNERDRIITVVIHPGWVRTDMGGSNASLSAGESVTAMLATIVRLKQGDNGKFLNYDGGEIPY